MPGFLIKHRSLITGSENQNKVAYADKRYVREYVKYLNKKYENEIEHWVINAPENNPFLDIRDYKVNNFDHA
jgi:hypothetical protein